MIPYVNQSTSKTASAGTSITTTALAAATNNGDTIIVVLEFSADPGTITITDSASNTGWTLIGAAYNWTGTKRKVRYVLSNITGGASYTVTCATTNSIVTCIAIAQIIGGLLLTASIADNTAQATATSNSPASGNVTLTNANELVITEFSTTTTVAGLVLPTNYQSLSSLGTVSGSAEAIEWAWKIEPSSPVNPTWTVTGTPVWGCTTVSLLFQNIPNIQFHESTGSDTLASGAGPGTAITGTAAATHSNQTVNITDAVALGSVLLDGSATILVQTSSGRKSSRIVNITGSSGAWVVTTQDSFGVTDAADSWAIGGMLHKLSDTNGKRVLTDDARAGWSITLNANAAIAGTITLNTAVGDSIMGPIVIQGASEWISITQSNNAANFTSTGTNLPTNWEFRKLQFLNSNVSKSSAVALSGANATFRFVDCIIGDPTGTNKLSQATSGQITNLEFIDCAIINCTGHGISVTQANSSISLLGTAIIGSGGSGINGTVAFSLTMTRCLITKSTSSGITDNGSTIAALLIGNTIDGNGSHGLDLIASLQTTISRWIFNNLITNNGGWGFRTRPGQDFGRIFEDYNDIWNNTLGNFFPNMTQGVHDISVDPQYVSTSGNNWGIGSNVQSKGFPDATRNIGANQSATVNYIDLGAAQHQATGGAGVTWLRAGIL